MDQGSAGCGQLSYGRQVSHRDQGETENSDGLERESETKGYTRNEPGVRGRSSGEEISRKAEYWQGEETALTESEIKAPERSAKASGTGGEHWDSVGKVFRTGKNRTDTKIYMWRMGLA